MTPKEAKEKYGEEVLEKMIKTGWLDGITTTLNKDGIINIPDEDYERAYRAAKGEYIHSLEWD